MVAKQLRKELIRTVAVLQATPKPANRAEARRVLALNKKAKRIAERLDKIEGVATP